MTHKTQNKCAILSQVLLHKLDSQLLVCVALQFLHEAQVLLDVAVAVSLEGGAQDPGEEAEAGHGGHKDHPEPDEQIDLLVEEVDGQDALHGVPLHVAKATHLEVTHGDPGKPGWGSPVLTFGQGTEDFNSIEVEVLAQEGVQGKQLANHVSDVQELDKYVEDHQIVALATATEDAACAGEAVLEAHSASCLHLTLAGQVP